MAITIHLHVNLTYKPYLQSPGLNAIGMLLFITRLLLGDRSAIEHSSLN